MCGFYVHAMTMSGIYSQAAAAAAGAMVVVTMKD